MRAALLAANPHPSRRAIPHNRPTLGLEEPRAAERVLVSGWLAQGAEVEAFENEVCAHLGLPPGHAVATSSGTAALFLALRALGARDARVGCPAYACSALANAIAFAGATPVLIDNERDRPNVDIAAMARADAAIAIVPHMFGLPANVTKLGGMPVIEDCAQALGASVRGAPVGVAGTVGIFSFYATKVITSGGQGGMLVSRDRGMVDAVRDFRQFDGRDDRRPRFNFQMTDLQAAIGRAQLGKLPSFLARRGAIFTSYRNENLELVDAHADATPVRYRAVVRTPHPHRLIERLAQRGITAIVPVEERELLAAAEHFPHAAAFANSTVSLPIYPSLRDGDVSHIVAALRSIAAREPSLVRLAH
jgi:perosamine synthetase